MLLCERFENCAVWKSLHARVLSFILFFKKQQQDGSVIKLTQELAQKLGLRIRKAYVRAKVSRTAFTF